MRGDAFSEGRSSSPHRTLFSLSATGAVRASSCRIFFSFTCCDEEKDVGSELEGFAVERASWKGINLDAI